MKKLVPNHDSYDLRSEEILDTVGREEDAACLDEQVRPNTAEESKRSRRLSHNFRGWALTLAIALTLATGCTHVPPDLMQPDQSTLKIRSAQSRTFDSCTDSELLRASVAVLQDMGYSIKESEADFGVLTATKEADATSAGQVIGAIALAALGGQPHPIDKTQYITVTMVILDRADPDQALARTTFQRIVQRTDNSHYAHPITEPEVYQEFYAKLDKALFLEVNKL